MLSSGLVVLCGGHVRDGNSRTSSHYSLGFDAEGNCHIRIKAIQTVGRKRSLILHLRKLMILHGSELAL
jgi:hypothetical protein